MHVTTDYNPWDCEFTIPWYDDPDEIRSLVEENEKLIEYASDDESDEQ